MNIKNKILSVLGALLLIPGHFALATTLLSNPYAPMGSQSNPVNVQSSGGSGIPLLSNPYAPVGSQSNPIYIQEARSLNSTQPGSLNPSGYQCAHDSIIRYTSARDKAYQKIIAEISSMEGANIGGSWTAGLYTSKGRISVRYVDYLSDCYRIDQVLKSYEVAKELPVITPTVTTSTVSGCTSTFGYSPTTGKSCSGSVVSVTSVQTAQSSTTGVKFSRNLMVGSRGVDVTALQQILISGGFLEGDATGFFGQMTKVAVIKFQNEYSAEVLAPAGLTTGTGFVGVTTRIMLNTMGGSI